MLILQICGLQLKVINPLLNPLGYLLIAYNSPLYILTATSFIGNYYKYSPCLCEIPVPTDYDTENNLSLKPLCNSDVPRKGKTE